MPADVPWLARSGRGDGQRAALRLVAARDGITVEDVARELGVREGTARRRLAELAALDLVRADVNGWHAATAAGVRAAGALARKSPAGRRERRKDKVAAAYRIKHKQPELSYKDIARRIAREFGEPCSASTVRNYFWDPDAEKAREIRARYRGRCEVCGEPTSSSTATGARRRCPKHQVVRRTPVRGREEIIKVLREWEVRFGERPTSTALRKDWARRKGGEAWQRWQTFGLHHVQVIRTFKSFRAALDAAFPDRATAAS